MGVIRCEVCHEWCGHGEKVVCPKCMAETVSLAEYKRMVAERDAALKAKEEAEAAMLVEYERHGQTLKMAAEFKTQTTSLRSQLEKAQDENAALRSEVEKRRVRAGQQAEVVRGAIENERLACAEIVNKYDCGHPGCQCGDALSGIEDLILSRS